MRKLIPAVILVGALFVPASTEAAAPITTQDTEEGCQAFNPGQPKCTFTATHSGGTPVTGAAGVGSWTVKVKRGKSVTTLSSPASGEPTATAFNFAAGDKVTATANTPGSVVIVGHPD